MKFNARVLDVSHYNTVGGSGPALAGFEQAANAGIWGIIHKATEAARVIDRRYEYRREAAIKAGLLWGAYHFMRPGNVKAQVDHFLQVSQPEDDTLLALDYEDHAIPLANARAFMEEVKDRLGRYPVIYSGDVIKERVKTEDDYWGQHRLWLSHYSANPKWSPAWEKPWLIQFTDGRSGPLPHKVPGVTLSNWPGIDINHYDGDKQQLTKEWAE